MVSYYAIFLADCKGWSDGRAGQAVKHVQGWVVRHDSTGAKFERHFQMNEFHYKKLLAINYCQRHFPDESDRPTDT